LYKVAVVVWEVAVVVAVRWIRPSTSFGPQIILCIYVWCRLLQYAESSYLQKV